MNLLPPELIREILLVADKESLQQLCVINKYSQSLCNDQHFWDAKFELYQLPKLKLICPFEDYKNHYNTNHIDTYINIYNDLLKAQDEAKDVLTIYNQNKNSDFIIYLGDFKLNIKEQNYYIPISRTTIITKLGHHSFTPNYIKIISENNIYHFKYTVLDKITDHFITFTISINIKELIDILTLMLYGNTTFYNFEIDIT